MAITLRASNKVDCITVVINESESANQYGTNEWSDVPRRRQATTGQDPASDAQVRLLFQTKR